MNRRKHAITLSDEVWEKAQRQAAADRRSVSDYIENLLKWQPPGPLLHDCPYCGARSTTPICPVCQVRIARWLYVLPPEPKRRYVREGSKDPQP